MKHRQEYMCLTTGLHLSAYAIFGIRVRSCSGGPPPFNLKVSLTQRLTDTWNNCQFKSHPVNDSN